MKACDYQEHESICGSRTDECDVCRKRVMLRNMNDHNCNSKPRHNPYRNTSSGSKNIHPHHPSVPVKTHPSISVPKHSIPPTRVGELTPVDSDDTLPQPISPTTIPVDKYSPPDPDQLLAASGSNTTIVFDSDWVDSVSKAIGDRELDSVIASTAFQEDVRKKTKQYQDQFETEAGKSSSQYEIALITD